METENLLFLRILTTAAMAVLFVYVNKRLHKAEVSFTLGVVWLLGIGAALLIAVVPEILSGISSHAGAEVPVHFLFFSVQFFLVLLVFGLTLKSAKQEQRIIRLTQELALLRLEHEQGIVLAAQEDKHFGDLRKRANEA